jgi:hypothetical protein
MPTRFLARIDYLKIPAQVMRLGSTIEKRRSNRKRDVKDVGAVSQQ